MVPVMSLHFQNMCIRLRTTLIFSPSTFPTFMAMPSTAFTAEAVTKAKEMSWDKEKQYTVSQDGLKLQDTVLTIGVVCPFWWYQATHSRTIYQFWQHHHIILSNKQETSPSLLSHGFVQSPISTVKPALLQDDDLSTTSTSTLAFLF